MLTKLSILLVADFGLQQTHLSLSWAATYNSMAESLTLATLMHADGSPVSLVQRLGVGLRADNAGSRFSRPGRKTSFKKTNVVNVLLL